MFLFLRTVTHSMLKNLLATFPGHPTSLENFTKRRSAVLSAFHIFAAPMDTFVSTSIAPPTIRADS
jgi:hypothetical protein